MKVRVGFVSNSSSASFIVEVKGNKEDIFKSLHENIEDFQEESYRNLLNKEISWKEKSIKEYSDDLVKKRLSLEIEHLKKDLQFLDDLTHVAESSEDPDFSKWQKQKRIEKIVREVCHLQHCFCSEVDDGYISFQEVATIYNDWGDISHRKTLIEILAFFTFMRYSVRTRIVSDI